MVVEAQGIYILIFIAGHFSGDSIPTAHSDSKVDQEKKQNPPPQNIALYIDICNQTG